MVIMRITGRQLEAELTVLHQTTSASSNLYSLFIVEDKLSLHHLYDSRQRSMAFEMMSFIAVQGIAMDAMDFGALDNLTAPRCDEYIVQDQNSQVSPFSITSFWYLPY